MPTEYKFDAYPFRWDVMTAENLVMHLKPALDTKILSVCYPKLEGKYRETEQLLKNLSKAQSLIQCCRMSLPVVPPIVLKDIDNFWDGVDSVWIPWTFREFQAGRLPLIEGEYSRELPRGLINSVMLTPVRAIYPDKRYFDNTEKWREEGLKSMFNEVLYGGSL